MRSKLVTPPLVAPGKSVILVGNGPGPMHVEKGHLIDQYDEIFRFNEYKIKGYEKHVGRRTTVYCTFGHGLLPADIDQRPDKLLHTFSKSAPAYKPRFYYAIPAPFMRELTKEIASKTKRPPGGRLQPSSGFLVARWLLDSGQCDCLTLAGFDHFQKTRDKRHHYWIPKTYAKPKEHDGDVEMQSLAEYEGAGKIQYLT